ncbi:MAG: sugar ABC transporter permease [Bifidobacteriaceae bacterium]|nr:sugar ABC transporter permease [Bifidobacteriaceae bacterium]
MLAAVIGYPVVQAVWRSFFSDPVAKTPEFVGLDNYVKVLAGDLSEQFWASIHTTLFFSIASVTLEVLIGLAMALVMNRAFRGRAIVRASILVPWAIPTAVAAVMWKWVFNVGGVANSLLGASILWTGAEWPAKTAIIIADVWKTAPFIGLLTLAGLQAIPADLYEAARVDGAGPVRSFFSITLPLVRPALVVAVLFRLLDVLRIYDLPQIFTNGSNNTMTLSILVVRQSIGALKAGVGSALSTLTFLIIFAIAIAYIRMLGANVMAGRDGSES